MLFEYCRAIKYIEVSGNRLRGRTGGVTLHNIDAALMANENQAQDLRSLILVDQLVISESVEACEGLRPDLKITLGLHITRDHAAQLEEDKKIQSSQEASAVAKEMAELTIRHQKSDGFRKSVLPKLADGEKVAFACSASEVLEFDSEADWKQDWQEAQRQRGIRLVIFCESFRVRG
jgi:hypothetical protein